jgi:hypothetical protein
MFPYRGLALILIALALAPREVVAVIQDPWEYRLAPGTGASARSGVLQLRPSASAPWGTICSTYFGSYTANAKVACLSAGLPTRDASFTVQLHSLSSPAPVYMANVACSTSAPSLSWCTFTSGATSACPSAADVVLTCAAFTPTAWDAVLVGNPTANRLGRLQLRAPSDTSAPYRAVCSANFNAYSAAAACRSAGYAVQTARVIAPFLASQLAGEQLEVNCPTTARTLADCATSVVAARCSSEAYVDCRADEWQTQLVGGASAMTGRLEVRPNASAPWNSVCDDGFTAVAAIVACRSAGFNGASLGARFWSAGSSSFAGVVLQPVAFASPLCQPYASSIAECSWSTSFCTHSEDIVLTCYDAVPVTSAAWEYRLTNTTAPGRGQLEVRPSASSEWGSVCDDLFDAQASVAACRALGWVNATRAGFFTTTGRAFTPVWMDDLRCPAGANSLQQCTFTYDSADCASHVEDIGLDCTVSDWELRLVDGSGTASTREGILQLRFDRASPWGTVCSSSGFAVDEANAACRDILGVDNVAATYTTSSLAGVQVASSVPIHLTDVSCSAVGSSTPGLGSCLFSKSTSLCSHGKDIYLHCSVAPLTAPNWEYRFRSQSDQTRGTIELRPSANASWGTVCALGMGSMAARAACRSMGISTESAVTLPAARSDTTFGPVWMAQIACTAFSPNLRYCGSSRPTLSSCQDHLTDAHVDCRTDLWSYRLVGGTLSSGRFEFRRRPDDAWSTLCFKSAQPGLASAACRSLGFPSAAKAVFRQAVAAEVGPTDQPMWTSYVTCLGTEAHLAECAFASTTNYSCTASDAAVVSCTVPAWADSPWEYRLSAGASKTAGRLEVRPNSAATWGTVCDDGFGEAEAQVACRSLGFGSGAGALFRTWTPGTGPIYFDDVACATNEDTTLAKCALTNVSNCNHQEDIGVDCTLAAVQFRLAGGSARHGRVEWSRDGASWGSVSSRSFSAPWTLCRALGNTDAVASWRPASAAPEVVGSLAATDVGLCAVAAVLLGLARIRIAVDLYRQFQHGLLRVAGRSGATMRSDAKHRRLARAVGDRQRYCAPSAADERRGMGFGLRLFTDPHQHGGRGSVCHRWVLQPLVCSVFDGRVLRGPDEPCVVGQLELPPHHFGACAGGLYVRLRADDRMPAGRSSRLHGAVLGIPTDGDEHLGRYDDRPP